MPKQIKRAAITVNSQALKHEPEVAVHIAIIATAWAEIEDELTFLFIASLQAEPAISAAVFGKVFSIDTKLAMVRTAMSLRFPKRAVKPFGKLSDRIKRVAAKRNRIVHGIWTTDKRYPNAILRIGGITDPLLGIEKYEIPDLVRIEIQILREHSDLKQFAQSLSPYLRAGETGRRERFWRLTWRRRATDQHARNKRLRVSQGSARSKRPRPKRAGVSD